MVTSVTGMVGGKKEKITDMSRKLREKMLM